MYMYSILDLFLSEGDKIPQIVSLRDINIITNLQPREGQAFYSTSSYTVTKIPFMYSFSGNSAASAPISTFMFL
jgi:hypothetical protein